MKYDLYELRLLLKNEKINYNLEWKLVYLIMKYDQGELRLLLKNEKINYNLEWKFI
jgi:hypothetical protein